MSGSVSQGTDPDPDPCAGTYHTSSKKNIFRKTLIPNVLLLFMTSLKNDVNVPSKSNKQKNLTIKNKFLVNILKVNYENRRTLSRVRIR